MAHPNVIKTVHVVNQLCGSRWTSLFFVFSNILAD